MDFQLKQIIIINIKIAKCCNSIPMIFRWNCAFQGFICQLFGCLFKLSSCNERSERVKLFEAEF